MLNRSVSLCLAFVVSTILVHSSTLGADPDGLLERVKAFQRKIIDDEITGSNLVVIGSTDGIEQFSVVNSGRPGDRDVDQTTVFPIWSMSKPITIVAMMTLREQGKFKWDDPVSKYLPCFSSLRVKDGDEIREATEVLTIEHLMAHRSGWGYYAGWEDGAPNNNSVTNPIPPGFDRPHPNQTRFNDLQTYCQNDCAGTT